MRRVCIVVALAGCTTGPQDFDEAYLRTYCLAFEAHCEGVLQDDPCRASGTPISTAAPSGVTGTVPTTLVLPPFLAGCTYHTGRAESCLKLDAWTCEDDGAGRLQRLVAPAACSEVWTCE